MRELKLNPVDRERQEEYERLEQDKADHPEKYYGFFDVLRPVAAKLAGREQEKAAPPKRQRKPRKGAAA